MENHRGALDVLVIALLGPFGLDYSDQWTTLSTDLFELGAELSEGWFTWKNMSNISEFKYNSKSDVWIEGCPVLKNLGTKKY